MNRRQDRPRVPIRCALLAVVAVALAGCANGALTPPTATATEEAFFASSPANIASLTDVVVRNPNDPQAFNVRGAVFGQAGKNEEALADFNKAISLDPNYAQAYANRALVYRHTRRLDLALADYNKAVAIDAGYAAAYLGRGLVHRQKGQLIQALQDFNKAIALQPNMAQIITIVACSIRASASINSPSMISRPRSGLSPQEVDPLIARGLSYLAVNDLKAAASDLDQAALMDQQNAHAWMSRALVYERLGDRNKAAGSYAQAMKIRPDYAPAHDGFVRVGGQTGTAYKTFD